MRACNCARASPFQSRTCEGCDPQLSIRQTMRISFNPCIRVGCDFRTRGEDGTSVPVSIHAPAWGATPSSMALMASATVFQSTHPRGVRPRPFCASCTCCWFQSTHPRGVRQGSTSGFPNGGKFQSTHPRGVRPPLPRPSACRAKSFNPRTRVGCDHAEGSQFVMRERVSIHAPAWGATCCSCCPGQLVCCFNPRTRVGCDKWMRMTDRLQSPFQSTHPRGVRLGNFLFIDGI